MSIDELRPGPAVRSRPPAAEDVADLAGALEDAPAVLVACPGRRLLDGHHRVAAARHRGDEDVDVTWWHGDPADMFLVALRRNAALVPVTPQERQVAAEVLLQTRAEMSDRWVARACGISPSTVGKLRRRLTPDADGPPGAQPAPRTVIGDDGKCYPVAVPRSAVGSATARRARGWRQALSRWWRWLVAQMPVTWRRVRTR